MEHAISIDAAYARAHAKLSETYAIAYMEPIDGDYMTRTVLDRALVSPPRRFDFDPIYRSAHAWHSLGSASMMQRSTQPSMPWLSIPVSL